MAWTRRQVDGILASLLIRSLHRQLVFVTSLDRRKVDWLRNLQLWVRSRLLGLVPLHVDVRRLDGNVAGPLDCGLRWWFRRSVVQAGAAILLQRLERRLYRREWHDGERRVLLWRRHTRLVSRFAGVVRVQLHDLLDLRRLRILLFIGRPLGCLDTHARPLSIIEHV